MKHTRIIVTHYGGPTHCRWWKRSVPSRRVVKYGCECRPKFEGLLRLPECGYRIRIVGMLFGFQNIMRAFSRRPMCDGSASSGIG